MSEIILTAFNMTPHDFFNESLFDYNDTDANSSEHQGVDVWRHPLYLLITYFIVYFIVFIVGLVGNLFVVIAMALNPSMRVITNYFITSLAIADLLVIIFCVPVTLITNVLVEWHFGDFLCKFSVWINSTAVCASVYTLVAVSADRYFAICHTMRYSTLEPRRTLLIIIPIWLLSGLVFTPYLIVFKQVEYPLSPTVSVKVCLSSFTEEDGRLFFMLVNFALAFLIPLFAIIACYIYIYAAIVGRTTIAVDKNAQARDQRVKLKVTHMMVTVVILFAASWFPFYSFFAYLLYHSEAQDAMSVQVMRAVLQWLTLANSCINPILYAYFSRKFRRAFREILVLPCRKRYNQLRDYTRSTRYRTKQIRQQISESVIQRVISKQSSARCTREESSNMLAPEPVSTITDTTDVDGNKNVNKRTLLECARNARLKSIAPPPSTRRDVRFSVPAVHVGRDFMDKPFMRNTEVISDSESSDDSDVMQPGMIALSIMTLPCLMVTARHKQDSDGQELVEGEEVDHSRENGTTSPNSNLLNVPPTSNQLRPPTTTF